MRSSSPGQRTSTPCAEICVIVPILPLYQRFSAAVSLRTNSTWAPSFSSSSAAVGKAYSGKSPSMLAVNRWRAPGRASRRARLTASARLLWVHRVMQPSSGTKSGA